MYVANALGTDFGEFLAAGHFFRSCMDMAEIQKLGAAPLKPWLDKVEKVTDHESLSKSLVEMAIADMNLFWSWWVDSDSEDVIMCP